VYAVLRFWGSAVLFGASKKSHSAGVWGPDAEDTTRQSVGYGVWGNAVRQCNNAHVKWLEHMLFSCALEEFDWSASEPTVSAAFPQSAADPYSSAIKLAGRCRDWIVAHWV
jgi:hypothetical protein